MLGAFFDDSGTHADSAVVAIGGLLGTDVQWDVFAEAWEEVLAKPFPEKSRLRQFHLTACRSGTGEFEDYNLAERDNLTYRFREIILNTGMVTLAAAVNKTAWDQVVVGMIAEHIGNPIEFCFYKCIELTIRTARFRRPGEKIHFFFDEGTRHDLDASARFYRSQRDVFPEIDGFTFAPVSKVVGLQGADMIAMETHQFGKQWIENRESPAVNAHFRKFISRELTAGIILDREHIIELAGRDQAQLDGQLHTT